MKNPSRLRTVERMRTVALACILLHNMNVDEREPLEEIDDEVEQTGNICVSEGEMCPGLYTAHGSIPALGTVTADVHLRRT